MKPTNPRIPASERRSQILAVASALFARQGFHGTTTRQIAEQVGVKEIILFRLFPTKQDLYWAVIEAKCQAKPGRQALQDALAGAADEQAAFTEIALGLLERNTHDTTLMRLLLFSALEAHELSERFFQTYTAQFFEVLATYIRRRTRAGAFRTVDPILAARGFLGMVFQYVLAQQLFGGARHHPFDHREVAETFARIWLDGIRNPKRKRS